MANRPGGAMASRPLHFIWLVDCSGSMAADGKVQSLNSAIREALPHMADVARENPNAELLLRAVAFSNGARWHVANPTPVEEFRWEDVEASGITDMGKAFRTVAEQLRVPPMSERALPPVLALLSDGQPSDDWQNGLSELMAQPWGKKAVRIAIAIGADADHEVLSRFIGNPELRPLQANNPEALVRHIRWVSTVVVQSASAPGTQQADGSPISSNVVIPPSDPSAAGPSSAADVW